MQGKFLDHHRFMLKQLLGHLDYLDQKWREFNARIEELMLPFARASQGRQDAGPGKGPVPADRAAHGLANRGRVSAEEAIGRRRETMAARQTVGVRHVAQYRGYPMVNDEENDAGVLIWRTAQRAPTHLSHLDG